MRLTLLPHGEVIASGVNHLAVRHIAGQYVEGEVHTNEIESYWSMYKRGIIGTYHHISPKHTARYAVEFAGRHNDRPADTLDQWTLWREGWKGNPSGTRT